MRQTLETPQVTSNKDARVAHAYSKDQRGLSLIQAVCGWVGYSKAPYTPEVHVSPDAEKCPKCVELIQFIRDLRNL